VKAGSKKKPAAERSHFIFSANANALPLAGASHSA
jgi:hypothetical protein